MIEIDKTEARDKGEIEKRKDEKDANETDKTAYESKFQVGSEPRREGQGEIPKCPNINKNASKCPKGRSKSPEGPKGRSKSPKCPKIKSTKNYSIRPQETEHTITNFENCSTRPARNIKMRHGCCEEKQESSSPAVERKSNFEASEHSKSSRIEEPRRKASTRIDTYFRKSEIGSTDPHAQQKKVPTPTPTQAKLKNSFKPRKTQKYRKLPSNNSILDYFKKESLPIMDPCNRHYESDITDTTDSKILCHQ